MTRSKKERRSDKYVPPPYNDNGTFIEYDRRVCAERRMPEVMEGFT